MRFQVAAELQVTLEGVSLPATKDELLAYARREDAAFVRELQSLPEREYESLDEVGEASRRCSRPRSSRAPCCRARRAAILRAATPI